MAAAAALTGRLTDVRKVAEWNATPAKASPKIEVAAEVAEIESDEDLERIGDYPEDGQQTGVDSTKAPSAGTGMPPFTQLRGIGTLITSHPCSMRKLTGSSCAARPIQCRYRCHYT